MSQSVTKEPVDLNKDPARMRELDPLIGDHDVRLLNCFARINLFKSGGYSLVNYRADIQDIQARLQNSNELLPADLDTLTQFSGFLTQIWQPENFSNHEDLYLRTEILSEIVKTLTLVTSSQWHTCFRRVGIRHREAYQKEFQRLKLINPSLNAELDKISTNIDTCAVSQKV